MAGPRRPGRSGRRHAGFLAAAGICTIAAGCGFRGQRLEVGPEALTAIAVTGDSLAALGFVGLESPRLGSGVGIHVPRSPDEGSWIREWTFQFKRDVELRMRDTADRLLERAGYRLTRNPESEGAYSLGGEIVYYDVETREGYSRDSVTIGLGIHWTLVSASGEVAFARDTWNEFREDIFSNAYGSILNLTNRVFLTDMIELLADKGFRRALKPATSVDR